MTPEEKKKAREFVYAYNSIYGKIDSVQRKIEDLKKEMDHLQNEMLKTRDEEKFFINNLRLIYGTEKINADYLLEALKEEVI
jgi:peptidoglycan hydrolase CwlO-like protein